MSQSLKKRAIHLLAAAVLTTSAVSGVSLIAAPTVSAAKVSTSQIKLDERAAVKKFNNKYADAKVDEIQLETKGNKYVYEISGFDSDKEYSANVNAKTGKVTKAHSEKLEQNDDKTALDLDKAISRKEANRLAEKATRKGHGQSWTLETDNGTTIWEVEVVDGHKSTDVKINAHDKKVISTEAD
jgi:uncharacterized membrane protein YkoI